MKSDGGFVAIRCGKVIMGLKDRVVVDLNVLNSDGIFPLHEASCSFALVLFDLFLQNRAKAD